VGRDHQGRQYREGMKQAPGHSRQWFIDKPGIKPAIKTEKT
jgi:hypothetical protein